MRVCFVLLLLLAAGAGLAQTGEGNLVRDPSFEGLLASNGYEGWVFVNHNQDFIRGEYEAQDYHSGLKAAAISVGRTPQVYACWCQHVPVKDDSQLPDTVSVWYRAPDSPAAVVMSFIGVRDGVVSQKGSLSLALDKSRDWSRFRQSFECPSGTTDIQLELRVSAAGEYRFDDVSLTRTEPDTAGGRPHRLLFVGVTQEELTDLWKDGLKKAGWQKISCEQWDNLNPALLKQCRTVALLNLPLRPDLAEADAAICDMLVDYVKAGGGLLLTQNMDQIVTGMTLQFALAERFGTRILYEKVISDKARTQQVGAWWADSYTYTDKVFAPLNEGVAGLPYQSYMDMSSLCGVLPFLPAAAWQVVLTAGPQSSSEVYLCGLEEIDRNARPEGFRGDVPLAGVREFGRGRVGYIGMKPLPVFHKAMKTNEDRATYDSYMVRDFMGKPNGLVRFYENAFSWLGARADALSEADLRLAPARPVSYTTAWKLHRGVIGPRTTCSSGSSTPDEYVRKARAAGLDFIVFLDDFASLNPGGFEQLKRDCRRLSTADFLAVPGVTYENSDGNHEYAFSESLKLPSKRMLTPDGKRLAVYPNGPAKDSVCNEQTWLYQLLGFESVSGWYLFGRNPYPHFDTRDVNAMGVIAQEDGRTVERVVDSYAQESRNGQLLWPQALTLMKNAQEMDLLQSGVYYHNVVGADGTQMLHTLLNTLTGRSGRNLYPGIPCLGCTSITNGPLIELNMPRGDTDAQGDIYNPALQEWPLDLKVSAPAGLREIILMDGDRQIRRFLPGGRTEFSFSTSLSKERQKYLWVRAEDAQGHEAISRDVQCDSWLLRDQQCADRNNQLLYSAQLRPDGTPYYVGYGGDTTTPDKGPWNGRVRPVGCFVFDSKLGSGAMSYDGSPENHPQASLDPFVVFDGKVPDSVGWERRLVAEREGAPHVQPRRVVSSSEVLVGDRVLDGVFPYEADPVIHVWHTLYPVKPSQYLKTTARCSFYLPKVDGVTAYLWEQAFTPLQDVPVKADSPFTFCLGTLSGWLGKTAKSERLIANVDGTIERAPIEGVPMKQVPFKRGTYLCFLNSAFGSLAVYSLSDDLVLWGDGVNYLVGIRTEPGVVKAGTQCQARLLLVGINRLVVNPDRLAAQVLSSYGIAGPPTYQVQAEKGEVGDQQYLLNLRAGKERCFRGTLRGLADLPGNLGAKIAGLNDAWSAVFQVQDGSGKLRIIPVEEGIGYAVLRAEDERKRLFIGHPFVADSEQAIIGLARSKDWKKWQVEIHNPTDKAMTVHVSANPCADGLHLDETLKLPAGTSVFRSAGPALAE